MRRGRVVSKRLVYRKARIGIFVLLILAFLVWGVLTTLASMNLFSGRVIL